MLPQGAGPRRHLLVRALSGNRMRQSVEIKRAVILTVAGGVDPGRCVPLLHASSGDLPIAATEVRLSLCILIFVSIPGLPLLRNRCGSWAGLSAAGYRCQRIVRDLS